MQKKIKINSNAKRFSIMQIILRIFCRRIPNRLYFRNKDTSPSLFLLLKFCYWFNMNMINLKQYFKTHFAISNREKKILKLTEGVYQNKHMHPIDYKVDQNSYLYIMLRKTNNSTTCLFCWTLKSQFGVFHLNASTLSYIPKFGILNNLFPCLIPTTHYVLIDSTIVV